MALPSNFSAWEHLQSVLTQTYNRIVREEFADADEDDISTPRSSLRTACLLRDDDSAIQTNIRMMLFYFVMRKAADLQPPNYTIPTDRYQQDVTFAPQVTLYFREDLDEVEEGYQPIDAEVSFRVMGETPQTFSESNAMALARRIQSVFTSGGEGVRWRKGRVKLSYRDKENGYLFSVNAFSESEGKELMRKVMSIRGDGLDENKLTVSQLATAPAIVPPQERIYGQTRRLPRKRPVGWVRFRFAECHIWGIGQPITLVDATLRRSAPLLRA